MKTLKNIGWLLGFFLIPMTVVAQEFTATANVSEIPLDSRFRLTYTLDNMESEDFRAPNFSPFQASGPSTSRNMSWVNGKVNQSFTYTYTLAPTEEGEFTIPPATVKSDGKVVKSNAVTIKVVPAGTAATPNNNRPNNNNNSADDGLDDQIRQNLFVRVIPSKRSVYEGEQITLTYKLYYALTLDDLSILKTPTFDGFLSHEIELGDGQRKVESYNGQNYNTQPIRQVALFPGRSGEFRIDPMELQALVLVRKNDPGYFFPRTERIKHEFKSNATTIEVKPLPLSGQPASFTGAVGQFDFDASYDKTSTQVDDPITLKISVSGKGNIKLIDVPRLDFPQSFEVYDPKIKESISEKSYTVSGSKTYEYLLIPRGGGTFELPDITFSYFDPKTGKYISRTEKGPVVEVEGDAVNNSNFPNTGNFSKEEVALLGDDIKYIKTGSIQSGSPAFITRPLFHLLTWLPLFLGILLPVIHRQRKRMLGDTVRLKSRKAGKEASKRMSTARKMMQSGDDQAFYGEVRQSILGYMADKFNLQNVELSRNGIRKVLADHHISSRVSEEVVTLIDDCEMAMYAGTAATADKEKLIRNASTLIGELEHEIKNQ